MTHPAIRPDHVAVVTGGASGIGLAAAQALGRAGMRVVIADRDDAALGAGAEALLAEGVTVQAVLTDVSKEDEVQALADEAAALGPVSVLMNNAGRQGGEGLGAPASAWRETIATNLFGPLYGIQAFLPEMRAADHPCAIINTGSKQGITLPPGDTAYNTSKAGLKALTESLAHDLLDTDGRITAHLLIPGFTFTGLTRAAGQAEKPEAAWTPEEVVAFMMQALDRQDFYILCPDNDVSRETDVKRMTWALGDITENRPALSRWHPDHAEAFKAFMARG